MWADVREYRHLHHSRRRTRRFRRRADSGCASATRSCAAYRDCDSGRTTSAVIRTQAQGFASHERRRCTILGAERVIVQTCMDGDRSSGGNEDLIALLLLHDGPEFETRGSPLASLGMYRLATKRGPRQEVQLDNRVQSQPGKHS